MKIIGNIALLSRVDRYVLDLPQECRDDYVCRLPLKAALAGVQADIEDCTAAYSEMQLPAAIPGFMLQRARLQWKYRRLQKMAGAVAVYDTEWYLKGLDDGTQ